jgi:hypothetical protein
MPDHLLKCLHEHLTKSAVEIVKLRIQRLKRWTSWASELAKAERDSKQRCDPKVEAVLGAKRLLLMEGVAKSINWPDTLLDNASIKFHQPNNMSLATFSPNIQNSLWHFVEPSGKMQTAPMVAQGSSPSYSRAPSVKSKAGF